MVKKDKTTKGNNVKKIESKQLISYDMDIKPIPASEDAHKQLHNTEHKIMTTTMNVKFNDGQRAAIVAALRESMISGAKVNTSCSKVINQVVGVDTTLDLFSGQGDVSTTTKQKKLTPKFLHEMEYLYLENDTIGKEATSGYPRSLLRYSVSRAITVISAMQRSWDYWFSCRCCSLIASLLIAV